MRPDTFVTNIKGRYFLVCTRQHDGSEAFNAFALSALDAVRAERSGVKYVQPLELSETEREHLIDRVPTHDIVMLRSNIVDELIRR